MRDSYDVIVVGGGAAGLMAAIEAGTRGRRVLVIELADRVGKKILISGGGRCNFTNLMAVPEVYVSGNPRFAISALTRYTSADVVALVSTAAGDQIEPQPLRIVDAPPAAVYLVAGRRRRGIHRHARLPRARRRGL